jgi:hypothetical protein
MSSSRSFLPTEGSKLAELLIHELSDFRINAFTHDPIWFDILRRRATAWEVRRIVGWSYELRAKPEDYDIDLTTHLSVHA